MTRASCNRWKGLPTGVGVPCGSRSLVGKTLSLHLPGQGNRAPAKVEACVVPARPTAAKQRSSRACEGAYRVQVKGELGPRVVAKSKLREWARNRGGLCPEQVELAAGMVAGIEHAAELEGVHPFTGLDLPFPHRVASSVCCLKSRDHVDELATAVALASFGSVDEERQAVSRVAKALPRALRPRTVATIDDAAAAVAAMRDHCWDQWREADRRARARERGPRDSEVSANLRNLREYRAGVHDDLQGMLDAWGGGEGATVDASGRVRKKRAKR